MQFRIRDLLLATTFCALTCAGLVYPNPLLESLYYSLALFAIMASALSAIALIEGRRAYALGFLVASSAYLSFAHVADQDGIVPRHAGPELTTQLLRVAFNKLDQGQYDTSLAASEIYIGPKRAVPPIAEPIPQPPWQGNLSVLTGGGQRIVADGSSMSFMRIGHSAWAMLLGWIAAVFTRALYLRSRRRPAGSVPT